MDIFQGSIFYFFFAFISTGNRFHNLAPKFETLSIPYCVVRVFFRAK